MAGRRDYIAGGADYDERDMIIPFYTGVDSTAVVGWESLIVKVPLEWNSIWLSY